MTVLNEYPRPTAEGAIEISQTWGTDTGDYDVIAKNLVDANKKKRWTTTKRVDIERAITGIQIADTIYGSSTLTISLFDPEWKLVDSEFFDVNKDGKLDRIDIEYPDRSSLYWRLTQVGIDANRGGALLELTFMELVAAKLVNKKGPKKTKRTKVTRAQFIRSLVNEVHPKPKFHCKQLDKKQPKKKSEQEEPSLLGAETTTSATDRDLSQPGANDKDKGIPAGSQCTVKGVPINETQRNACMNFLSVGDDLNAPELAIEAMTVAAIGESDCTPKMNLEGSGYGGVFQGDVSAHTNVWANDWKDTALMAKYFLKGGKGFQGGGAIALAKASANPGGGGGPGRPGEPRPTVYTPGAIATKVEASGKPASFYDAYIDEARAIIEAYGGAGPGTTDDVENGHYEALNYEVKKNETYWDAIQRLAGDVKWAIFVDGNHVYYEAETTLTRQMPARVIHRRDPTVLKFTANWDIRKIATEASLDLVCSPFEFRAGDVLLLDGFGPASSGSLVSLPGRWLVSEIRRDRFGVSSQITLKQPTKPGKEDKDREWVEADDPDSGPGEKVGDAQKGSPIPGQAPAAQSTHQTGGLPGYPAFDYMAPAGTKVVAPVSGKIRKLSGRDPSMGGPAGGPLGYSIYLAGGGDDYFMTHLDKVTVKVGDQVKQGEQIAEVADGPASWSTPHCHMGVHSGPV